MTPNLPSRPRPEGEKARYVITPELLNKLSYAQGYNFAEAMHRRAEQLKQEGYISSFWEGILNDVNLVSHYVMEVYWLKPPPPEFADMERFREAPKQLAGPTPPRMQC